MLEVDPSRGRTRSRVGSSGHRAQCRTARAVEPRTRADDPFPANLRLPARSAFRRYTRSVVRPDPPRLRPVPRRSGQAGANPAEPRLSKAAAPQDDPNPPVYRSHTDGGRSKGLWRRSLRNLAPDSRPELDQHGGTPGCFSRPSGRMQAAAPS